MVRLIMGANGAGKTKQLIELVHAAVESESGSVVCIEPSADMTYDISYNARLINASEYGIDSYACLRGFVSGLYAGNYDISHVFVDNLGKIAGSEETLLQRYQGVKNEQGVWVTPAASSNLLFAPLPMMVFDLDTEAVLWSNDSFLQLSGLTDKLYESHLDDVIPDFDTHWLLEGKRESPELVTWNHRQYRVFGGLGRHEELPGSRSVLATTYWMDVTEFEQMRQTVELTRPVMAIVMIDNYEDLMKACPENKRSALLAALEEKLDRWTADTGGLLLGYDRDRYLFVFEERSFSNYASTRFSILDSVREVVAGDGVAATLSIGVGRDAESYEALFKSAGFSV